MKDKKKFKALMTALAEVFEKELSDTLIQVYWKIFEPYSDLLVTTALNKAIGSCKYFPKPGEIIEFVTGGKEESAVRAWEMVDSAMRKYGNYRSIDFGDPKIHKSIQMMGGWGYLGTLTEEEWKWKRKEFESIYKSITGEDAPQWAVGLCEIDAKRRGYEPVHPIKITDGKETKRLQEVA